VDVYKLRLEEVEERSIEKERFEEDTHRQEPWFAKSDDGKDIHFAVCPACDNPIQIIGLYHLPANITRPYGRHFGKTVRDLAPADIDAREDCPYFKPRQHKKTERKGSAQGVPSKLLRILIEQFDRVIYLLQKETGLGISYNLAKRMLEQYRREQGHLYTGATLTNIPWVFAYMADAQSLFGQRFDDEELKSLVLSQVEGASFTEDNRVVAKESEGGKKNYFDLDVCYLKHRIKKDNEESGLIETMEMVVSTAKAGKIVDIHKRIIKFDYQYFQNLISLPSQDSRRNLKLVELAREVLGDLLPSK
jgi:hypothetical protein